MLNIFFDGSTEGTAHSCKTQLGLEGETMMSLELFLHAGKISVPMSVHSRKKVYDAYFDGYFGIVSKEIRRLKKYLKKGILFVYGSQKKMQMNILECLLLQTIGFINYWRVINSY